MQEFREKLNYSLRFLLFLSLPCGFGLFSITPDFVPFFFGDSFSKTVTILCILSPLSLILGISFYLDNLCLIPSGNRKKSAIVISIAAVANVILSILFVKRLLAFGAAIATVITETFVSLILIYMSKNFIEIKSVGLSFVKYLALSLVMAVIVITIPPFFGTPFLNLITKIALGGLFYLVMLFILGDEFVGRKVSR